MADGDARLSTVTVQNIAMLIDIYENYPARPGRQHPDRSSPRPDLGLRSDFVPRRGTARCAGSKPFFDLLDTTLSDEI